MGYLFYRWGVVFCLSWLPLKGEMPDLKKECLIKYLKVEYAVKFFNYTSEYKWEDELKLWS